MHLLGEKLDSLGAFNRFEPNVRGERSHLAAQEGEEAMSTQRDFETSDRSRTVTVIEGADPPVRDHAEGVAHTDDVRTTRQDGYSLARGWMRTFNLFLGFLLLVLETVLAFRLAFQLGGANSTNGFVDFIYDVSHPFQAPFAGIANHSTSGSTVFEPETVIATAVWAAVTILFVVFVNVMTSAPAPSERETVSRDRYAHIDRQS